MLFIKDKSKKTVFITGGAIRVGRLLVEFFVSKDWNVAFSYKSSENEARELEGKYEGDVKAYRVDFMNGVKGVLEKVLADFGRVDVLINNASVFAEKEFLQVSGSELDEYLNLHVKAPFFLIQEFVKMNKEGCVINITDNMVNNKSSEMFFPYVLTKKYLHILSEMLESFNVHEVQPGKILADKDQKIQSKSDNVKKMGEEAFLSEVWDVVENFRPLTKIKDFYSPVRGGL